MMTFPSPSWCVAVAAVCCAAFAPPIHAQVTEAQLQSYLWPQSVAEFESVVDALSGDPSLVGISREHMLDLAELMRAGRAPERLMAPPLGGDSIEEFFVDAPGGRTIPVYVRLPSRYSPDAAWPMMFAMHGGPPGSEDGARQSALRMVRVWADAAERAGWIVVAPAMTSTVSRDGRTQDRLPYEVFHPEEARAVIAAVRQRYSLDPDRIVSTGISLGSNFSIAYGAAHPDWFSAIVPVSTEGDSREHLLRNLKSVPTYVLEGSQDRNIRGVGGPRSLQQIMTRLGYDLTYREFGDRAHEGFQEHYADVLRWLSTRARQTNPREVLRVPHLAIMPTAKRVHWVEVDNRQVALRARVTTPTHIDIEARWAGELTLFLNDELVNLDAPITVSINGKQVFEGEVERSAMVALQEARRSGNERRVYSARLHLSVPNTPESVAVGQAFWASLAPQHTEGQLSFWEMYAQRALEERFPDLGFSGEEVELPGRGGVSAPEQTALRVTSVSAHGPAGLQQGDLLLSIGGESFFRDRGGVGSTYQWMVRELRETPRSYSLSILRDGAPLSLTHEYHLGAYVPPPESGN